MHARLDMHQHRRFEEDAGLRVQKSKPPLWKLSVLSEVPEHDTFHQKAVHQATHGCCVLHEDGSHRRTAATEAKNANAHQEKHGRQVSNCDSRVFRTRKRSRSPHSTRYSTSCTWIEELRSGVSTLGSPHLHHPAHRGDGHRGPRRHHRTPSPFDSGHGNPSHPANT